MYPPHEISCFRATAERARALDCLAGASRSFTYRNVLDLKCERNTKPGPSHIYVRAPSEPH
jgi:hypothetical protein